MTQARGVEQGSIGELCYIHENKMVSFKLTRFGELC
jgi:hypothetical protein